MSTSALALPEPGSEPSTSYGFSQQPKQQQRQQQAQRWPWQQEQQHQQQREQHQSPPIGGNRRRVTVPRGQLPLDLLVARPTSEQLRPALQPSDAAVRRANRDAAWARAREPVFAALAAGFHVALFAYNLAFWGFEGTAPDRYWPANPRYRLQMRPGRYGNLEGTKSLYYYYLSRMEGGK